MRFEGSGRRLTPADFKMAAGMIHVPYAALRAVVQVEAGGSGYDAQKRPKILFEPHVFFRLLGNTASRGEALRQGLAYPTWGTQPYPRTSQENYDRLEQAMTIAPEQALMATSWGMPQIMGENFREAGYASVMEMVTSFVEKGEAEHVEAMARFIRAKGLSDELQRADWAGFARGYNGSGFRRNRYDEKLAAAYRKFSANAVASFVALPNDGLDLDARAPAFSPEEAGNPDLNPMPEPDAAPVILAGGDIRHVDTISDLKVAIAMPNATATDLKGYSSIIARTGTDKLVAGGGAALVGGGSLLSTLGDQYQSIKTSLQPMLQDLPHLQPVHYAMIVAGVLGWKYLRDHQNQRARVENFRNGEVVK